jgi:hypothetical protein
MDAEFLQALVGEAENDAFPHGQLASA